MAAMVSSNMTDSGSSASRVRSPSPGADTCPSAPMLITVAKAPRRPGRVVQTLHMQGAPRALEQPPQSGQLQEDPLNAAGAAGEQSPQPQPAPWACMRTAHAPQRQPAPWDRAETPVEQDGQLHDLPQARLQEGQEHPLPRVKAPATAVPLPPSLKPCRPTRAVEEAPFTRPAAGTKNASTSFAAQARAAATKAVDFICSECAGGKG